MSLYQDRLTKKGLAQVLASVSRAFPAISPEALDILRDRFVENGFTDNRARDALNHVIDTYEGYGGCPNIANFIQYDRRVQTLTYRELCTKHDQGTVDFADYTPIDIGQDKPRFAKREDVERYSLKKWEPT
ncbi:MAG: hypothetical protein WCH05_06630 [Chlorobiaceae bacterium]